MCCHKWDFRPKFEEEDRWRSWEIYLTQAQTGTWESTWAIFRTREIREEKSKGTKGAGLAPPKISQIPQYKIRIYSLSRTAIKKRSPLIKTTDTGRNHKWAQALDALRGDALLNHSQIQKVRVRQKWTWQSGNKRELQKVTNNEKNKLRCHTFPIQRCWTHSTPENKEQTEGP